MKTPKQRVLKALEELDSYSENEKTYFKVNDVIYVLSTSKYNKRREFLRKYFENKYRDNPSKIDFWINHNMTFGSPTLDQTDTSRVKIEVVYDSAFACCFKIIDPDGVLDDKDIMFKRSIGNMAEEDIEKMNEWNTAYPRSAWLTEFALKVRNWLGEGLQIA